MNKSKLYIFGLLILLLTPLSVALGQYNTPTPIPVTIGSNGQFNYDSIITGGDLLVTYNIQGTPGATGTITAMTDNGNPQADATVPSGTSLTKFITISIDMNASDFTEATITITYTDADVAGISPPYAIYKYIADNNQYVELPSTTDTAAHTITVTLTSPTDPILAIGGTSGSTTSQTPMILWAAIVVVAAAIVLVAFLVVRRMRQPKKYKFRYSEDRFHPSSSSH